ncbi:hypothetical protein GpartN1_g3344.t1 [Galdieria partita]|uniref:Uncharacterized protein n=1 Tax=Galdieria partita TaxID=83374 RepID=A0A9C7PVC5_9RHOD|nr:hypothetical protein GpartN1_g3344.t1 [Galdieria partita]
MSLVDLSKDSTASSLLKTISTNRNGHKKTKPARTSTQQTTTITSPSKKESLWDYSDVFGQEWEEGLGTAHRVFAENTPTVSSTELSKSSHRDLNKGRPPETSVQKKPRQESTSSVEKSHNPHKKVGYSSKRGFQKTSFKDELELWRLRSVQSISSESRGFAREPQDTCVASNLPKKRVYDNESAHRRNKKEAKKIEGESSEEESSDKEVYTFEDLMKEEERSARIAAKEDAEEYQREKERKRKKQLKRLATKKKSD